MSSDVLNEHRGYLSDPARMSAYRRAICEVVTPGDIVLDLGAGTGILGLLACEAGASRVYSVEADSIISLTRDLCRANGFEERVQFIRGHSTEIDLPEKVDVVVCDQIGSFGYEAGVLEYLADAHRRFLKPGGRLMPSRIHLEAAPVQETKLRYQVDFWNNSSTGFNLKPAHSLGVNCTYGTEFKQEALLGDPVQLGTLEMSAPLGRSMELEGTAVIARPGVLHGLGGWFTAELSATVRMTNSPAADKPIERSQVFFPTERPVPVDEGDRVQIRMRIIPSELLAAWNVAVVSASGESKGSFAQSTFQGMPLAKEDLLKMQPQFVPELSRWGQVRQTVLNLCDGSHSLADVEEETYRRHTDVFRSAEQAAAFVADVLKRNSR